MKVSIARPAPAVASTTSTAAQLLQSVMSPSATSSTSAISSSNKSEVNGDVTALAAELERVQKALEAAAELATDRKVA